MKKLPVFGPFLEEWKEVKGFENNYSISNYGRVFSVKNYTILNCNNDSDYKWVRLINPVKSRRVDIHVLVAEHFIRRPNNKNCVNHKNGIKKDNFFYNLEWCTFSENIIHAIKVLGRKQSMNNHKKKIVIVSKDGNETEVFGVRNAARIFNIPKSTLNAILNGKMKSNTGIKARFKIN